MMLLGIGILGVIFLSIGCLFCLIVNVFLVNLGLIKIEY